MNPCGLLLESCWVNSYSLCSEVESMLSRWHFSHPFLGTYEVIQFFELVNLEGTYSTVWYMPPYQFHGTMGWKSHPIPFSFQYHLTLYHTIGIIKAFQFQSKPYHHSKAVTGCLGSFLQSIKLCLQAAILVCWAPSFVDRFFRFLLSS